MDEVVMCTPMWLMSHGKPSVNQSIKVKLQLLNKRSRSCGNTLYTLTVKCEKHTMRNDRWIYYL